MPRHQYKINLFDINGFVYATLTQFSSMKPIDFHSLITSKIENHHYGIYVHSCSLFRASDCTRVFSRQRYTNPIELPEFLKVQAS